MNTTTISAERIKLGIQHTLALKAIAASIDVRMLEDQITATVTAHITAVVTGRRAHPVVVRRPADWWQAVRERWAPHWWIRRHPVRYTVTEINAAMLWTRLAVPDPYGKLGQVLFIDVPITVTGEVEDL